MPTAPRWPKTVLLIAGAYHLGVGLKAALLPGWVFPLAGLDVSAAGPNALARLFGVLTAALGVAFFAAAASDPLRSWPVALAGLFAKVFSAAALTPALLGGELPAAAGYAVLVHDVLWWLPLGAVFVRSVRAVIDEEGAEPPPELTAALADARAQDGRSLLEMSREGPVLAVFLRHLGCTFCKEAVADVAARRAEIEAGGTTPVFVHIEEDAARAEKFFARYGVADLPRVADPAARLYRALGLKRVSPLKMITASVLKRGQEASRQGGHGIGVPGHDVFRLGGVFLLRDGRVVREQRLPDVATRPDYCELAAAAP